MVIVMYDLSKAFTAPSVRTKPVFFIVEYSSMLFILRDLYGDDCGGRDDHNCDCDGSSSKHVVDLKLVKYNIVVFVLSQTLDLNINNQTSGQVFSTCNRGRCQCLPHPWELGHPLLWTILSHTFTLLPERCLAAVTFKQEMVFRSPAVSESARSPAASDKEQ